METALALGDARSHAAVEALPLPPKAAGKVHQTCLVCNNPHAEEPGRRGADFLAACLFRPYLLFLC